MELKRTNNIIFQGKKGLFISGEEKILFPHKKSFTDAKVGLVKDITITSEKDTYGFFNGTMVENVQQDIWDTIVKHNIVDASCYVVDINGCNVLIVKYVSVIRVFVGGESFCEFEARYNPFPEEMLGIDTQLDASDVALHSLALKPEVGNDTELMCRIVSSLKSNDVDIKDSFMVYGNRFLVIPQGSAVRVHTLNTRKGKTHFMSSNDSIAWMEELGKKEVPVKDVVKFCQENNIAMYSPKSYKDGTASINVDFMGNRCRLKMFGGSSLTGRLLANKDMQAEVKASVESFDQWKAYCGKSTSRTTQSILSAELSKVKDWRGY